MPEKGKRPYPLVEAIHRGGPKRYDSEKRDYLEVPEMVGDWHSTGYLVGHTESGAPLIADTLEVPGGPGIVRMMPSGTHLRIVEMADAEPGPELTESGLYRDGVKEVAP